MAWVDDRIYCHPKMMRVSEQARWFAVAAIAYSSGWQTRGIIEPGALQAIGCKPKHKRELVTAGLWDEVEGVVLIHDWDDHNGKRDERRRRERERRREARESGRWKEADREPPHTPPHTPDGAQDGARPNTAPQTAPACVDGSEGSEGNTTRAVNALRPATRAANGPNGPGSQNQELHPQIAALAPNLGQIE